MLLVFLGPDTPCAGAVYWSLVHASARRSEKIVCLVPEGTAFPRVSRFVRPARAESLVEEAARARAAGGAGAEGAPEIVSVEYPVARWDGAVVNALVETADAVWLREAGFRPGETFPPGYKKAACFVVVIPASVEMTVRAERTIGWLLSHGVPASRLRVGVCAGASGAVSLNSMRERLARVDAVFPDDPAACLEAENGGLPLAAVRPRSRLTKEVARLAALCRVENSTETAASNENPELAARLERRVYDRLRMRAEHRAGTAINPEETRAEIDREIHAALADEPERVVPAAAFEALRQKIFDHAAGFGPFERFLRDPSVSEIMANGAGDFYVERGGRIERVEDGFASEAQLRLVIDRMVGAVGRRVDTSSPLCDLRLPDGSRVNVALPPVALAGPVVTVRRFRPMFRSMDDLIREGSVTVEQAAALREAVTRRRNIVIAGNAGSGKTTLLNVLSGWISPEERIITLEDAAELQLQQPHVVRLETRPKNAEGEGEISMERLVVNALRMRPDRLIVGECRGAEAIPMLQAMNTGHDGSMTTVHANSAKDAVRRLESMVLLGAPGWPLEAVRAQIASGVGLIVFLKRVGGRRRLEELFSLNDYPAGEK